MKPIKSGKSSTTLTSMISPPTFFISIFSAKKRCTPSHKIFSKGFLICFSNLRNPCFNWWSIPLLVNPPTSTKILWFLFLESTDSWLLKATHLSKHLGNLLPSMKKRLSRQYKLSKATNSSENTFKLSIWKYKNSCLQSPPILPLHNKASLFCPI